jgi:serine/threonine protein kinase
VILYELATGASPWNGPMPKMIAQIKAGQFLLPSRLNPLCADLIRRLLRLKPEERLKCDQILAHPWLSTVPARGCRCGIQQSLLSIVQALQRPCDAIVSPLEKGVRGESQPRVPTVKETELEKRPVIPPTGTRNAITARRRGLQLSLDRAAHLG